MDFGSPEDNEAMDNRLNNYYFTGLSHVRKEAAKWIRDHPINCIVWAAQQSVLLHSECNEDANDESDSFYDTGLSSKDKLAIISLNLGEEKVTNNQEEEDVLPTGNNNEPACPSQPASDSSDSYDEEDIVPILVRAKANCEENVGKARMIGQLIQQRKESDKKLVQNVRRRNYEHRCQYLRELGIEEEMVELEPSNPRAAIPDPLQQEINQKSAEKRAAENEKEEQRLKTLFKNTWLKEKEKESAANATRNPTLSTRRQKKSKTVVALNIFKCSTKIPHRTPHSCGEGSRITSTDVRGIGNFGQETRKSGDFGLRAIAIGQN